MADSASERSPTLFLFFESNGQSSRQLAKLSARQKPSAVRVVTVAAAAAAAARGQDPDVSNAGSKLEQDVAPWLCFSVAVCDRNQLPHRCGFVQVRLSVLPTTPTPHCRSRNNRMTPPSTGLRRGCLSDKTRSKSDNTSSARRVTMAARGTAILAGSATPLPRYIVLLVVPVTNAFACFVFSLSSDPFPFPMRHIDARASANSDLRWAHTCRHSLRHAGLPAVVVILQRAAAMWCVVCWSAPCVCDSQQQNSLENVVASSLHSALKGTRGSRTNAKNSDSRFGRKT